MASRPPDALYAVPPARRDNAGPPPSARVWGPLALYAGIPLLICLYLTFNNWQLLDQLGFWSTLWFYAAHAAVPWAVTAISTWGTYRALARWQPGLGVLTVVGSLLACILMVPYTSWLMAVWSDGTATGTVGTRGPYAWDWADIAGYALRATLLWLGANLLFDRFLGYPRYRYPRVRRSVHSGAEVSAPPAMSRDTSDQPGLKEPGTLPGFMERLKKPAPLDALIAIRAEQHYLRVITDRGSELVLYRLSDALRELPEDLGIQVHRSWWVRRASIAFAEGTGKKMTVMLTNGERIPVSTPHQALVRAVTRGSWRADSPGESPPPDHARRAT